MLVLDSGERGLERDSDYRLESPILVLRVILGPQQFSSDALSPTAAHLHGTGRERSLSQFVFPENPEA